MGKIVITMDIDPEYADEAHEMGVTEAGHDRLTELLYSLGSNIEIEKAEP